MANLLGQNIGTNYKGILNLNTLNGNLSGTLQAVTDGDGNASPLQLSTSQVSNVFAGSHTILWRANATLTDYSGWHQADGTFIILKKDNNPLWINIDSGVNFSNGFGSTSRSSINAAGNWSIGGSIATNLARLHVRGDGTNPVFRVESTAGANFVTINNSGQLVFGSSGANEPLIVNYNGTSTESGTGNALRIRQRANLNGTLMQYYAEGLFNNTTSGTNISHHFLSSGYAGAAGNGNYRATQIDYTINNSGVQTGTATGIFLNATETALNGMTHNLMDLQVGGVSRFRVSSSAAIVNFDINGLQVANTIRCLDFQIGVSGSRIFNSSDGVLRITNNVSNDFGRLQFGGTTNAFPALKRNSTALDVRLADDSGFATINANSFTIGGTSTSLASNTLNLAGYNVMFYSSRIYIDNDNRGVAINNNLAIGNGNVATNSSSVLECISTTKGFLPPRMTTAQKTAITSPAKGLVVYDTDTDKLCVYNGAWTDLH